MNYNEKMFELGNHGSAIRELYEYGRKRKRIVGDDNVFDFSIGNPSIPAPDIVNKTLIKLISEKSSVSLHGYTSAIGDEDVRIKIADYLNDKYDANVKSDKIYLTCGAAASLAITLSALLNKDDEVIVFAPFFPEYKVYVENASGKLVITKSDDNFMIDFNALDSALNKNTKAVIINSPNNPSGAVLKEDIIVKLSSYLKKKEKEYNHPIYLISDEPYREIIYDDIKYPFVLNYYDDSIVCYSFSKSLSLPGERIGYIVVSNTSINKDEIFKAICGAGRALGYVCAPAIFQYLIALTLGYTSDIDEYKKNRDYLYNSLKDLGYDLVYPDGAFYLFMKALEEDSIKFSNKAKEYDLLLVPSDSFGVKGYVRIAYCVSYEMIKRSISAFKKLKEEYDNK